ncbi:hypothetical protein CASFOL_005592 [Castilleja foliolosa]|uniref:Uncharacterized protein n=1 Tax=Castilleja foliolosa TaxID=1961234 RepID=A0ABD3E7W7_9LAMI
MPESSDIINTKKRARKPCFGWISDDDDEDDEFQQLTPAKSVESCCMNKNC